MLACMETLGVIVSAKRGSRGTPFPLFARHTISHDRPGTVDYKVRMPTRPVQSHDVSVLYF